MMIEDDKVNVMPQTDHKNDLYIETEKESTYPKTTLCSEEDLKYNKLQAKILKDKLTRANKKPINTLGTITENKEANSVGNIEDTSGFQLVINKKNKNKTGSKQKTEIINNSEYQTEKKHEIIVNKSSSNTNKHPDKSISYKKGRKNIHTIENLNSYAPLDPNIHIEPKQYKSVIKARRNIQEYNNNNPQKQEIIETKGDSKNTHIIENDISKDKILAIPLYKLTLREYIQQHKDTGLNRNMPFLTTKSKQIPILKQIIINEKERTQSADTTDGNNNITDWNQIGDKKAEQKLLDIYDETSETWLPRNLPRTTRVPDNTTLNHTSKILPLTIRITKPKSIPQQIQPTRVLVAVLGALQQQYPDSYLGPIIPDAKPLITSLLDVPTDEVLIQHYIERPSVNKERQFLVRIIVHSNYNLGTYKEKSQFRQYLAKEHIVVDYNNLDSIDPVHVGFIEDIVPRYETLQLHHTRLVDLLPTNAPPFQLNIQSIYGRSGSRSKAVMVNCDIENEQILKVMLDSLHKNEQLEFYPWKEYVGLPIELKEVLIRKQNNFLNNYRTIILSGFIDNDDNVPMYMVDEEELEDLHIAIKNGTTDKYNSKAYNEGFESLGVTEYLQNYIFSGDKTTLFEKVYPPIEGMREVVLKRIHLAEALDFSEVFRGELARCMNSTAIALVFNDPTRALNERANKAWEPHKRYQALHEQYQHMVDSTPNRTTFKRNGYNNNSGHSNKSMRNSDISYAQTTKYTNKYYNNNNYNENMEESSFSTTANLTNTTEYKLNVEDIKTELRGEFKLQMEELKQENAEIKQNLMEFQKNSQLTQNKQESSLERIEKFMQDQKNNYDEQFAKMNGMFMMFMSTQMKNTTTAEISEELNAITKRKLGEVQKSQTTGNELPSNRDEASIQLNRMDEDTAVDHSGGRPTTNRTKND
jgi:hypothetical protein